MEETMRILYIEDDQDDIELLQDALKNRAIDHDLTILEDGNQAVTHVDAATSLPHLILLDLNLPKVNGKEVLKYVKSIPHWRDLPLLVLSTTNAQSDRESVIQLGANQFMTKPVTSNAISEMVDTILELGRTGS